MKTFFFVLIATFSIASLAEPIFDNEEDQFVPPKESNQPPQMLDIDGMPEYPDDNNLRQLNIRQSRSIFYVDIASISSSKKENIVSLVTVAVSPHGARTVTYEGLDCGKRRYQAYGYAGAEGPLRPFEEQDWKLIIDEGDARYRRDLVDNYLCGTFAYAFSREKILARMKRLKPYARPSR